MLQMMLQIKENATAFTKVKLAITGEQSKSMNQNLREHG